MYIASILCAELVLHWSSIINTIVINIMIIAVMYTSKSQHSFVDSRRRDDTYGLRSLGWVSRRVVSVYDVVNASYLPTTINIYDLEIRSINNYRKSYTIASFLVSRPTTIYRRCRFGNSKPCKYIRSSYVRRKCIYDNNRVSANISSYDYR